MGRIALIGDYDPTVLAHQAIPVALERAGREAGGRVTWSWIDTASLGPDVDARLAGYTGIWCVPASPYVNAAGAIAAEAVQAKGQVEGGLNRRRENRTLGGGLALGKQCWSRAVPDSWRGLRPKFMQLSFVREHWSRQEGRRLVARSVRSSSNALGVLTV